MAWVVGVSAFTTSGTSVTTAAIDTTGTNLLAAVSCDDTNGINLPSDSKSNTWTAIDSVAPGNSTIRTDYVIAATTGTGHTFTVTIPPAAAALSLCVDAFSGRDTVAPLTQHVLTAIVNSSTNPRVSGSITTTEIDDLWGCQGYSDNLTITTTSPWTLRQTAANSGTRSANTATQDGVAAGTYNSTFTWSPNNVADVGVGIASFQAAAAVVPLAAPFPRISGLGIG